MMLPLNLNKPQKRIVLSSPSSATSVWGRGTGKSFVIGWLLRHLAKTMPKSKWGIVGQTYRQIMTRTLPSSISGLSAVGQTLNTDYIINSKPPRRLWELPHEPPLDWTNFMLFRSGFGAAFISLEGNAGAARGMNLDGIITDETLLINKEKFEADVLPAKRGNLRYFSKHPMHHGVFHFTSMPYGSHGRWILDHGNYYRKKDDFEAIRRNLIALELEFIDCQDKAEKLHLWSKIIELKKQLRYYKNKLGLLYSEADIFDNITNIGLKYVQQQRESLTDFIFLIEILNQRSTIIEGGFYPGLNPDIHLYGDTLDEGYSQTASGLWVKPDQMDCRFDGDCMRDEPLRLAVDWGSRISVLSIAQLTGREYRFINCMYVKHPKLIDDLAKQFLSYYKWHPNKEIDFIPDIAWGNKKQSNSIYTYNEKFIDLLEKGGWDVHIVNTGIPMDHQDRYLLWNQYLREENPELLVIRFNKEKCRYLVLSMQMAPVKEGRNGRIEKDKSSERNARIPQEEATHFSDTADQHLISIDKAVIRTESAFVPNRYGS